MEDRGQQLEDGVLGLIAEKGYPLSWTRVGSMASLFFTPGPVTDWHTAARVDKEAFQKFFWKMLDKGFYLAPSPFEAMFISAAHTTADIQSTLDASAEVLAEVFNEESRS
jgi:glutamate-1-semialdehyde 2,1-aminomutase